MRVKETEEIAINLVHISDLIEMLGTDSTFSVEDRKFILHGQLNLARMGMNNILKIIVKT